jgi:hypothetical protein
MDVLVQGSRGFKVQYLQRMLNLALVRDRAGGVSLREDGRFGPKTDTAVRDFQGRHRPLIVDGKAGDGTWAALGLSTEREHPVQVFGQPTNMTCWSAAATMLLGNNQSVGPGSAALDGSGGLTPSTANVEAFAQSHGLRSLGVTPDVRMLVAIVRQRPVWIAEQGQGFAHAVILSAVYSNGNNDGHGTMFRIHDPWPPNVGRVYGSFADPISILNNNNVTMMPAALQYVLTQ